MPSDSTTATLIRASWSLLHVRYSDSPDAFYVFAPNPASLEPLGHGSADPPTETVLARTGVDRQQKTLDFLTKVQNHAADPDSHGAEWSVFHNLAEESSRCSQNVIPEGWPLLAIRPTSTSATDGDSQPSTPALAALKHVPLTLLFQLSECHISV